MALAHHQQAPIFTLPRELLRDIFTVNTHTYPYSPNFEYRLFPVTITRRSSQVCRLWRDIILASPMIWGRCLDIDILEHSQTWADEVLRRAGNSALLAVRGLGVQTELGHVEQGFARRVIRECWERIMVLDIEPTWDMLRDAGVQDSLCRPAPNLREFYLYGDAGGGSMPFSSDARLFGGQALMLTRLYIGEDVLPQSLVWPSRQLFESSHLRSLTIRDTVRISGRELLDSCRQMLCLEELSLNISSLTRVPEGSTSLSSSVSLPQLESLWIYSSCLEVYPDFLRHLIARPRKRRVLVQCHSFPVYDSDTLQTYARAIHDTLRRDMSSFFGDTAKPGDINYLEVSLSSDYVCFAATRHGRMEESDTYTRVVFEGTSLLLPPAAEIQNSLATIMVSLPLPSTICEFRFTFFPSPMLDNLPPLSPLFAALGSVRTLRVSLDALAYITEKMESNDRVFFPSLKFVALDDMTSFLEPYEPGNASSPPEKLCSFFVLRVYMSHPVEVLDLTKSILDVGDITVLETFSGLRVVWRRVSRSRRHIRVMEYICGSGDPERLLMVRKRTAHNKTDED
ncbi:hypothetical protein BDN70DRAFT_270676 [Pholiota conissans]|uniref:F-box domain-containing protein n=1 Tax=Pholiota conissans TaxID=109636 RepID=A0A9P5YU56_9AGAR|nr:hypothetical protein BDN70DRAFT_270676 [Pholiota conissans]